MVGSIDVRMEHEPIVDWSVEGRRRLVEERGDEIRLALDEAFTDFLDESEIGLRAFGFRADDPVSEAVEWCVARFGDGDLNPGRLRTGSASFRLFTEVEFWLSQKVGGQAYRRIRAVRREERDVERLASAPEQRTLAGFGRALGATLERLRDRTCAALVEFWLFGTRALRSKWFGWDESGTVPEVSLKARSFHAADAQYRFAAIFEDVLATSTPAREVAIRACFSGCTDAPPYRATDAEIRGSFPKLPAHELSRHRVQGLAEILSTLLDHAEAEVDEMEDGLRRELLRRTLTPSLLHAHHLEDPALHSRIRRLRPMEGG